MDLQRWLASTRSRLVAGVLLLVAAVVVAVVTSSGADSPRGGGDPPTDTATGATAAPSDTVSGPPAASPSAGQSPKGSLSQVPVDEVTPEPAVDLSATADFGDEVAVRISRIEKVAGVARGPGEVAGPALRLTLEVTNSSNTPLTLESMVVALETGADRAPAPSLTGPNSKPFAGDLSPGRSATGVYVYAVPEDDRDAVEVTVSSTPDEPVVVFRGSVAP